MASSYEYTTDILSHGLMGRSREELDRKALQGRLNEYGAEGWELVKVLTDMALQGEKDGHLLIFRRAL